MEPTKHDRPSTPSPTLVQRIGDYRLITHERVEELRALLVPKRPAKAIVGLFVDRWPLWTAGAAGVGATLNSLVLPSDPTLEPLWRFLTVERDGPPLTVPAVPKRHRCPCGSGRMYGRCHGQR